MAQQVKIRGQHVRETLPTSVPADSANMTTGTTTNADAVVSIAADTQAPIIVSQVWWSYIGGTVTGNLTISDGSNTPVNVDINSAGTNELTFSPPLSFGKNATVAATLKAGGVGVTGKVGLNAYRMQ